MNTQNIRCKFILSFTTINCTQIYNKMLKFTKTEAHTHRAGTAPIGSGEERRQTWSRAEPSLAWNRPCTPRTPPPIDAMLSLGVLRVHLQPWGGLSLPSEQCVSPVN